MSGISLSSITAPVTGLSLLSGKVIKPCAQYLGNGTNISYAYNATNTLNMGAFVGVTTNIEGLASAMSSSGLFTPSRSGTYIMTMGAQWGGFVPSAGMVIIRFDFVRSGSTIATTYKPMFNNCNYDTIQFISYLPLGTNVQISIINYNTNTNGTFQGSNFHITQI